MVLRHTQTQCIVECMIMNVVTLAEVALTFSVIYSLLSSRDNYYHGLIDCSMLRRNIKESELLNGKKVIKFCLYKLTVFKGKSYIKPSRMKILIIVSELLSLSFSFIEISRLDVFDRAWLSFHQLKVIDFMTRIDNFHLIFVKTRL